MILPSLTLVILHPQELQSRMQQLQQTVQLIQTAAQRLNIKMTIRQVPQLKPPHHLFSELKGRVAPKPTGIEEIDDWIDETHRALDKFRVSQWFHHEIAIRACFEDQNPSAPAPGADDILWIIEDDTIFVEKSVESVMKFMRQAFEDRSWKILFTGACHFPPTTSTPQGQGLMRPIANKLPISHESFLVRGGRAKDLLADHETIRSTYAGFLWWMSQKYSQETFGLAKALTIDGSKLGLFPSTMSPDAEPILNNDYRQLKQLITVSTSAPENRATIKTLVNKLRKIQCTNGLIPYLHLLEAENKHDEAMDLAEELFQWKSKQQALLTPTCPILKFILDHYRDENTKKIKEIRTNTVSKIAQLKVAYT